MGISLKFIKKFKLRHLLFAYDIGKMAVKVICKEDKPVKRINPETQLIYKIYELYNIGKENQMEGKLKSRKFWITMVPAITMILGAFMAPEAVEHVKEILIGVLGLLGTYNIGQGMVDAKKATAK